MPTAGTILAKNMKIFYDATAITCQVDATLSMNTETFQTTCKDSGAWAESFAGTKSWSVSGTGNYAMDATNGFEEIFTKWDSQATAAIIFQTAVTGDTKYSGTVNIKSLELVSSGNDAAVTFSFEFEGTGALVKATVS